MPTLWGDVEWRDMNRLMFMMLTKTVLTMLYLSFWYVKHMYTSHFLFQRHICYTQHATKWGMPGYNCTWPWLYWQFNHIYTYGIGIIHGRNFCKLLENRFLRRKISDNCANPVNHTHNLHACECTCRYELVCTAYIGYMASEAAGIFGRLTATSISKFCFASKR